VSSASINPLPFVSISIELPARRPRISTLAPLGGHGPHPSCPTAAGQRSREVR
jgi:hypothetical protein